MFQFDWAVFFSSKGARRLHASSHLSAAPPKAQQGILQHRFRNGLGPEAAGGRKLAVLAVILEAVAVPSSLPRGKLRGGPQPVILSQPAPDRLADTVSVLSSSAGLVGVDLDIALIVGVFPELLQPGQQSGQISGQASGPNEMRRQL